MSSSQETPDELKKTTFEGEETPQPHFIPGYTGFCPGLRNTFGESYGRSTQTILESEPSVAERLKPIENSPYKICADKEKELQDEKNIIGGRSSVGKKILKEYMPPGYTGHIPHNQSSVGINYNESCVNAIASFEREQLAEHAFGNQACSSGAHQCDQYCLASSSSSQNSSVKSEMDQTCCPSNTSYQNSSVSSGEDKTRLDKQQQVQCSCGRWLKTETNNIRRHEEEDTTSSNQNDSVKNEINETCTFCNIGYENPSVSSGCDKTCPQQNVQRSPRCRLETQTNNFQRSEAEATTGHINCKPNCSLCTAGCRCASVQSNISMTNEN